MVNLRSREKYNIHDGQDLTTPKPNHLVFWVSIPVYSYTIFKYCKRTDFHEFFSVKRYNFLTNYSSINVSAIYLKKQ